VALGYALFGPGQHKEFFFLFDYCQNHEYFSQSTPTIDGFLGDSLSKRLFDARLEVIASLDRRHEKDAVTPLPQSATSHGDPQTEEEVRRSVAERLQREVAAMNLDNFIVRPHARVQSNADLDVNAMGASRLLGVAIDGVLHTRAA